MQYILGWVLVVLPGTLYLAQVISSINFGLAQKIGIQEFPEESDSILQRAERYVAYWDLVSLIWMPLTGVLILMQHKYWPIMGLFAGAIFLDAAGREAVKMLSFRHEGVRVGGSKQHRLFFASYFLMAILGVMTVFTSVHTLIET